MEKIKEVIVANVYFYITDYDDVAELYGLGEELEDVVNYAFLLFDFGDEEITMTFIDDYQNRE